MGLISMGFLCSVVWQNSGLSFILLFHSFRMGQWAHSLPNLQMQWQLSGSTLLVSLSLFLFIAEIQGLSHSTFSWDLPKQSIIIWSAVNCLLIWLSSKTGIGFMPHMGHAANLGSHDILLRQTGQNCIGLIRCLDHSVGNTVCWLGSSIFSLCVSTASAILSDLLSWGVNCSISVWLWIHVCILYRVSGQIRKFWFL